MSEHRSSGGTVVEPVVTTYHRDEMTGEFARELERLGAREGDGLIIERGDGDLRVRRVAPLEAGKVYHDRHEFLAAMKALGDLR